MRGSIQNQLFPQSTAYIDEIYGGKSYLIKIFELRAIRGMSNECIVRLDPCLRLTMYVLSV